MTLCHVPRPPPQSTVIAYTWYGGVCHDEAYAGTDNMAR